MRCPASSHWPRSSLPCGESIRMPHTKRVILRLHLSSVSRMARLASRQAMFGLTEVVGSSIVTAMRGRSAAAEASGGRAEAATSVPAVRRNSRRCTRELYIAKSDVGNQKKASHVQKTNVGHAEKPFALNARQRGKNVKADPSACGLAMTPSTREKASGLPPRIGGTT
jgi:hypothetical protein